MIMRRPHSRTATRRAHRFKIGKTPRPQSGRLNDKLKARHPRSIDLVTARQSLLIEHDENADEAGYDRTQDDRQRTSHPQSFRFP